MKSKILLGLVLSIALLSTIASYSGPAFATPLKPSSFTLSVSGTAYDPHQGKYISVQLTLYGTVGGEINKALTMFVQGGTLKLDAYATFAISPGWGGLLVLRWHLCDFYVKVTPQYGGRAAYWDLDGSSGTVSGSKLPVDVSVSFYQHFVWVPVKSSPALFGLFLAGTLTLKT